MIFERRLKMCSKYMFFYVLNNYMKLDRFLLSYNGNKYMETKKYLHDLDISNYDIITEPFGGIFGFSRAMIELNPNFKGEIWINDINTDLINILKELKNNSNDFINKVIKEAEKYKTDLEVKQDNNKSNAIKLIFRRINFSCFNLQKGYQKINNYKEKIEEYNSFFEKVKLFNLPFEKFIELLPKKKKCLIFLDPPYFNSSNTDYDNSEYNKDEDGYRDGTKIYTDIYELFNNNNNKNWKKIFILNKIHFINNFFGKWKFKEYSGKYNNTSKTKEGYKKSFKKHIIYMK